MSQWTYNLTLVQNCGVELHNLMELLRFIRTYNTKSRPPKEENSKLRRERKVNFQLALSFAKSRLKSVLAKLFKVQQTTLSELTCSKYNRMCLKIFEKPLKWLELSLRKIMDLQTKTGEKKTLNLQYFSQAELIISECVTFLNIFLITLNRYQTLLRFGVK